MHRKSSTACKITQVMQCTPSDDKIMQFTIKTRMFFEKYSVKNNIVLTLIFKNEIRKYFEVKEN